MQSTILAPIEYCLEFQSGELMGQSVAVGTAETILIGRSNNSQIKLSSDDFVSRHHAVLVTDRETAYLRDLGSQNGIYVNGTRIVDQINSGETFGHSLSDGDRVQIGETKIFFRVVYPDQKNKASAGGDILDRKNTTFEEEMSPTKRPLIRGYRLESKIGEGGLGVVYRARRESDQADVAIKIFKRDKYSDENKRRLALREIKLLEQLSHPCIVEFVGCGIANDLLYVETELCDRGNLHEFLETYRDKVTFQALMQMSMQFLEGLAYAHSQSVIHRDIKPPNILLQNAGGTVRAKLADLGMAKNFKTAGLSDNTRTGTYGGTYDFMPKEQITKYKNLMPDSDVWSASATIFYTLTGKAAREPVGTDPILTVLEGGVRDVRDHRNDVPDAIAEVINKGLSENPGDRYVDAGAMLIALRKALSTNS